MVRHSNTKDVTNGHYKAAGFEVSLQQPKTRDIVERFHTIFDTGVEDPFLFNTVSRLRELLNKMVQVGIVGKYITGIYKERSGEHGTWCHSYRLCEAMLNNIKHGELTLDQAAVHIDKLLKEDAMNRRTLFRTPVEIGKSIEVFDVKIGDNPIDEFQDAITKAAALPVRLLGDQECSQPFLFMKDCPVVVDGEIELEFTNLRSFLKAGVGDIISVIYDDMEGKQSLYSGEVLQIDGGTHGTDEVKVTAKPITVRSMSDERT